MQYVDEQEGEHVLRFLADSLPKMVELVKGGERKMSGGRSAVKFYVPVEIDAELGDNDREWIALFDTATAKLKSAYTFVGGQPLNVRLDALHNGIKEAGNTRPEIEHNGEHTTIAVAKPIHRTERIKYVFIDVVHFTREDRAIEDLATIIASMNLVVSNGLRTLELQNDVLLIPTGDGICIGITNPKQYDIHLQLAKFILDGVTTWSNSREDIGEQYKLRIAVHEHEDLIVEDINGRENIAGLGINTAARLMDACEPGGIVVGQVVYDLTNRRKEYKETYSPMTHVDKHGVTHTLYCLGPKLKKAESLIAVVNAYKAHIGTMLTDQEMKSLKVGDRVYHKAHKVGVVMSTDHSSSDKANWMVTINFFGKIVQGRKTNVKGNYFHWS